MKRLTKEIATENLELDEANWLLDSDVIANFRSICNLELFFAGMKFSKILNSLKFTKISAGNFNSHPKVFVQKSKS